MKKSFLSMFIFDFVLALFLPACSQKDEKKKAPVVEKKAPVVEKKAPLTKRDPGEIILVQSDTARPLSWNNKGKTEGLLIDIAAEVCKRLKLKLVAKSYPWKRAQQTVKDGSSDAMITAHLPFRQEYSEATKEVVTNYEMVGFTYKNNPKLEQMKKMKTLEDSKPFIHGVYIGGWQHTNLKDKNGYKVDITPGMELCIKKLVKGRFDLLIDHPLIIRSTAKQLGVLDQLEQLPAKYFVLPFPVLISKKSKYVKLIPKIDEAIKAMKKDGTLKKLHEKY